MNIFCFSSDLFSAELNLPHLGSFIYNQLLVPRSLREIETSQCLQTRRVFVSVYDHSVNKLPQNTVTSDNSAWLFLMIVCAPGQWRRPGWSVRGTPRLPEASAGVAGTSPRTRTHARPGPPRGWRGSLRAFGVLSQPLTASKTAEADARSQGWARPRPASLPPPV